MANDRTVASRIRAAVAAVLLASAAPAPAATLAPLAGEEAMPLAHGAVEAHLDFAYFRNRRFPHFTPAGAIDAQNLFQLPRFGARVGLGDWVEIQASFEMLLLDEDLAGGTTNDVYGAGDARLLTKIRVLREHGPWPAIGLRFGAKLPNGNFDDRLGTDETDFLLQTLWSKDFGPVEAHVDLGLEILGNPGATIPDYPGFVAGGQDDPFTWGLAVAGKPFADVFGAGRSLRLLAEVRGAAGSRFDNDFTVARGGMQVESGAVLVHLGLSAGLAGGAEDVGVLSGVVYRIAPGRWFGGAER
jgi:hypothetical protein